MKNGIPAADSVISGNIRKLTDKYLRRITERSIFHCGVMGLHRIILCDIPGRRMILCHADKNHELWKNFPATGNEMDSEMSLGFHSHRHDYIVRVIRGRITSWVVRETDDVLNVPRAMTLSKYLHEKNMTGKNVFSLVRNDCQVMTRRIATVGEGLTLRIHSGDIHTIAVAHGVETSWIMLEGDADRKHEPFIYTNQKLDSIDRSRFNAIPSEIAVKKILLRLFHEK